MSDQLFSDVELPPQEPGAEELKRVHREKSPGKGKDDVPFEVALEELEKLVARMETGKQPLEQLIADFEAGSVLIRRCRGKLDKLEHKIELLTRDDGKQGQWASFGSDEAPAAPDRGRNPEETQPF